MTFKTEILVYQFNANLDVNFFALFSNPSLVYFQFILSGLVRVCSH